MKKILSILIFTILIIGLIAPLGVLAQKEKLKECCLIHQDMTWKTGKICPGTGGGYNTAPSGKGDCDGNTTTWIKCTATTPCKIFKTGSDAATTPLSIAGKYNTACPTSDPDAAAWYYSDQWGIICLINTITNVTNWLFYIMMIAVVIVFVIAGAWFMLAGGDVEKTGKAKGLMILGIVGLIVALVAKLIPSVVKLIIGM